MVWKLPHTSTEPEHIFLSDQPEPKPFKKIVNPTKTIPSAHMWVKTILVNGLKLFALKNQKRVLRPLQARSASSPLESPMPHFLPK
jgi:hypothetical protein